MTEQEIKKLKKEKKDVDIFGGIVFLLFMIAMCISIIIGARLSDTSFKLDVVREQACSLGLARWRTTDKGNGETEFYWLSPDTSEPIEEIEE